MSLIPITHNQVVPGSSPGGTTKRSQKASLFVFIQVCIQVDSSHLPVQ